MEGVWLIVLGCGAIFVRLGMALYASGLSRSKNAAGPILRGIVDIALVVLTFWGIGAAILFQRHNDFLGVHLPLICGWREELSADGFFDLVMTMIASGLVIGAVTERSRF